ncbi:hypothetical protein BKA93DRAFT_74484 [Sparassis latifolia]
MTVIRPPSTIFAQTPPSSWPDCIMSVRGIHFRIISRPLLRSTSGISHKSSGYRARAQLGGAGPREVDDGVTRTPIVGPASVHSRVPALST